MIVCVCVSSSPSSQTTFASVCPKWIGKCVSENLNWRFVTRQHAIAIIQSTHPRTDTQRDDMTIVGLHGFMLAPVYASIIFCAILMVSQRKNTKIASQHLSIKSSAEIELFNRQSFSFFPSSSFLLLGDCNCNDSPVCVCLRQWWNDDDDDDHWNNATKCYARTFLGNRCLYD